MSLKVWTSADLSGSGAGSSGKEAICGELGGAGTVLRVALKRTVGAAGGPSNFDVKLYYGNTTETEWELVFDEVLSVGAAGETDGMNFAVPPSYMPCGLEPLYASVTCQGAPGAWTVLLRITGREES